MLVIVGIGLMVVVIVGVIYSASVEDSRRRRIGTRVATLAMLANVLINAITSPHLRWFNAGVGVFALAMLVLQAVLDRRHSRGSLRRSPD